MSGPIEFETEMLTAKTMVIIYSLDTYCAFEQFYFHRMSGRYPAWVYQTLKRLQRQFDYKTNTNRLRVTKAAASNLKSFFNQVAYKAELTGYPEIATSAFAVGKRLIEFEKATIIDLLAGIKSGG